MSMALDDYITKANKRKRPKKVKKVSEILITPFFNKCISFPKKERLCSDSDIQRLFDENNFFIYDKIKLYWNLVLSKKIILRYCFLYLKKIIPKAVERNKIKRLIRESFRLNKNLIGNKNALHLGLIYLSSEIPNLMSLEKKIKVILHRLNEKL